MAVQKYLWIKGQRYWLYDTYDESFKAHREGLRQRKKNRKCRYFILSYTTKEFYPTKRHALYLNKVFKLW